MALNSTVGSRDASLVRNPGSQFLGLENKAWDFSPKIKDHPCNEPAG